MALKTLITRAFVSAASIIFVVSAAAVVPGANHPVKQLVEWELTANSEMNEEALRKMAGVILDRSELSLIPPHIRDAIDLSAFRSADSTKRSEILASLNLAELKRIVVLPAPIEYFEIPEDKLKSVRKIVEHELELTGKHEAAKLVHFIKDGVPHVRWFLHPLADAENSQIRALINSQFGILLRAQRGFLNFHFTASRSIIVFGDSYDSAISLKLSLPKAEGPFKNKAIHLKEFTAWSRHNAYIADTLGNKNIDALKLQFEPYGLGVSNSGQEDAFLFRNLNELKSGHYLLPAFAILSEEGAEIARLNGSHNAVEFWEQHFLKPLAFGMAELRARTGAEHTSPHTQNLLVELDSQMRPTGKVVVRDFDFYIDELAFNKLNRVAKDKNGMIWPSGTQEIRFNLRNGLNSLPSWFSDADYSNWVEKYFSYYKGRFSQVTGISQFKLFKEGIKKNPGGYAWEPVVDRNYITGGKINFHGIFFDSEAYGNEYQEWLDRSTRSRSAPISFNSRITINEPPPAKPQAPINQPSNSTNSREAFKTWDDLIAELNRSASLDVSQDGWESSIIKFRIWI
jgi:hypothetical protein